MERVAGVELWESFVVDFEIYLQNSGITWLVVFLHIVEATEGLVRGRGEEVFVYGKAYFGWDAHECRCRLG